jgi:2-polyprenyl-3-methyl-5-hydroxy-6-metoxy-1,4-benzoquinol methylase
MGADAIRLCQEILPEGHFIQGELTEITLPGAYFDYIRIDNALEHVPNPRAVISECQRLLRAKGQLLVYVPHGRSLSMRLMKGNSISAWIPFHFQLFTRKSLERLMGEAGFTDIQIYGYYPTSWLPLSFMQWMIKNQPTLKLGHPTWLSLVCYPVGWVFSRIGLAEELVGVGTL